MSIIVDGHKIALSIKDGLTKITQDSADIKKLAIFYVGDNKVIDNFIHLKKKFGESIKISVSVFKYPTNITEDFLIKEILEKSKSCDGALVQLPLPPNLDRKRILDSVPPDKDVDMLGSVRFENFVNGDMTTLPPVVHAISEIFSHYNIDTFDKNIVIAGNGILVGKPVYHWLINLGFNPTMVVKDTPGKSDIFKKADIIISGVGLRHFINKSHLKDGVVLIDAGSSSHDGSIYGDMDPDCKDKASLFSTVPGGVGPITVAALFKNLLYN